MCIITYLPFHSVHILTFILRLREVSALILQTNTILLISYLSAALGVATNDNTFMHFYRNLLAACPSVKASLRPPYQ